MSEQSNSEETATKTQESSETTQSNKGDGSDFKSFNHKSISSKLFSLYK